MAKNIPFSRTRPLMIETTEITQIDILEIKAVKQPSGKYRVWINGPEGMLFRAYNVGKLVCDLDGDVLWEATLHNKKPPQHGG